MAEGTTWSFAEVVWDEVTFEALATADSSGHK